MSNKNNNLMDTLDSVLLLMTNIGPTENPMYLLVTLSKADIATSLVRNRSELLFLFWSTIISSLNSFLAVFFSDSETIDAKYEMTNMNSQAMITAKTFIILYRTCISLKMTWFSINRLNGIKDNNM